MYVIAGATGHVGSVAAETLLAAGEPVTVIVRSQDNATKWQARGAHAVVADLGDTGAVTDALAGAAGAFLLVPPNYFAPDFLQASRDVIDSLATAVKDSGVQHTVLLSSNGAQHDTGTGPIVTVHWAEESLRPVAKNVTFLRAAYFMENWAAVLPVAVEHGMLPSFLPPDTAFPTIATADIGRFVADSLLHPADGVRIRSVAGPKAYSPQDIANVLSDVLGKPVALATAPPSQAPAAMAGQGFPQPMANLFGELYTGIGSGHIAFNTDATIEHGDTTPTDVFTTLTK